MVIPCRIDPVVFSGAFEAVDPDDGAFGGPDVLRDVLRLFSQRTQLGSNGTMSPLLCSMPSKYWLTSAINSWRERRCDGARVSFQSESGPWSSVKLPKLPTISR